MRSRPFSRRRIEQTDQVFLDHWFQNRNCAGQASTSSLLSIALKITLGITVNFPVVIYLEATAEEKQNFMKDFMAWLHHLGTTLPSPTLDLDELNTNETVEHRERFEVIAQDSCNARRFFRSEDDKYGNGPDCMLLGDVVAVVFGSGTPFALQPKGDEFLFLGSVYIHKFRDGRERFRC
jgi:hypothetical protein